MGQVEHAEDTVREFLRRANKGDGPLDRDASLYADGLGLDSLSVAELSALLEDELGSDPFSEGEMPATVGELLDFYATAPQASTRA